MRHVLLPSTFESSPADGAGTRVILIIFPGAAFAAPRVDGRRAARHNNKRRQTCGAPGFTTSVLSAQALCV